MGNEFVSILITEKMKAWAKQKSEAHVKGMLFDSDVDSRDSIYIGYLGEAIFWSENKNASHKNASGYDFSLGNKKIEIKANWTKFNPSLEHYLKIPIEDFLRTDPDINFCFICINTEKDTAWVLGQISKQKFLDRCELRKKGQYQSGTKFTYTTHCFEIRVVDLEAL